MPALRVFGRRWLIAEDDVPVPAFFMAVYHLVSFYLLRTFVI